MMPDPIVTAIRAIRDEFAAQCGYDIKKMSSNYGNDRLTQDGSTSAIRPDGLPRPKTNERAKPREGADDVRISMVVTRVVVMGGV